jgi:chromosome partitioning protein
MIITMVGLKGGVGKTTTAVHLSAYLQEKAPTLLIDADKNRSALVWARDEKLSFKVVSEAASPKWVGKFDHIVIDTEARPSDEKLQDLVEGCDLLVLPTTPRSLDLDALIKTVEILDKLKANFKILLTMVDPRSTSIREAKKSLQEVKLPLFKAEIPRLVAFERSPLKGVIVKDYPDPRSKLAWEGYKALGKEILP